MTNGGTVPVPPLVMLVQTVYHNAEVHCNDVANIENFLNNSAANILQHQH
jgi:hypothetical protein